MAIISKPFGVTKKGDAVTMFTMTNKSGASVSVIELGAIVTSIIVPDKNGVMADVTLGFDTLAQTILQNLREEFPYIRIVMAVPCPEQDKTWSDADRRLYRYLLETADHRILIAREYSRECMLRRNRFMVSRSSACIAYHTHAGGGTDYTVRYAKASGVRLIYVP